MTESTKALLLRGVLPLLVFLIASLEVRPVQSQVDRYGDPPYCLFSRVEVFPCTYRVARTPRPQANQFGVYSTRLRTGNAGRPTCGIRNRDFRVASIPTLGGDQRIKFIFSPGVRLEPPEKYGNQLYVLFNISCPADHLAFLNLTSISLEEPNCYNVNVNQTQCRDYVRVTRPGFGQTESCGAATTEDNMNQLEQGDLSILFRTSDTLRQEGFEANIICFKVETGNQEGCTRPGNDSVVTDDMGAGRKRRDLDDFHQMWKRHLAHLRRRKKRQAFFQIRYETINIPFGVDVFYRNKQLTFEVRDGGMEFREPITGIFVLNTFDRNQTISTFIERATQDDAVLALGGPGPLIVVGAQAYFQLFVINPIGVQPTPEEMIAINSLTEAQRALVTEENDTRLPEEVLNPPCPDPGELGLPPLRGVTVSPECLVNQRGKRQADTTNSDMLDDSAILTAIANENACNPVLRTSALATIELVQEENPTRLENLRATVTTTTAPDV